jgi:hypothetical protein
MATDAVAALTAAAGARGRRGQLELSNIYPQPANKSPRSSLLHAITNILIRRVYCIYLII